ncbi:hypothetical protein [Helicobacter suis]|uniref:hypothetical protein n=1 Tax=Helicobacter suis TaxID=104628 RepID=UPI0013D29407|nr:hypothetical protein [Helicobacter suis]
MENLPNLSPQDKAILQACKDYYLDQGAQDPEIEVDEEEDEALSSGEYKEEREGEYQ